MFLKRPDAVFLLLAVLTSSLCTVCEGVVQFCQVNATTVLFPVVEGTDDAFRGNQTAKTKFAEITRDTFSAGIVLRPELNPLFIAPPVVKSLKVTRVASGMYGPTGDQDLGIAVTWSSILRLDASRELTEFDYLLEIKFGAYFAPVGTQYIVDLRKALPAYLGTAGAFGIDVKEGLAVPDPDTPVTAAPVKPPTRRPTKRPTGPTRRPTRRPTAPISSCKLVGQTCASDRRCCSKRCVNGTCRRKL